MDAATPLVYAGAAVGGAALVTAMVCALAKAVAERLGGVLIKLVAALAVYAVLRYGELQLQHAGALPLAPCACPAPPPPYVPPPVHETPPDPFAHARRHTPPPVPSTEALVQNALVDGVRVAARWWKAWTRSEGANESEL